MLGVQFTWTVELGYGTPYLLSLGIPKSMTPLVWLAGPLSGLVIQPIVGVFSDTLDWKLGRRRPFIIIGAVLTGISMYMVAYARDCAIWIIGGNHGDAYDSNIKAWTIGFAVVGFYLLDFSINAVQASCRSLIMDIPPTDQQEVGNAWSGWMNLLGSVVGFFAGNLNLVKYFSPILGDTQMKILSNLAIISFAGCLSISCMSVSEVQYIPTEEDKKRSVWSTIGNIWRAFKNLPGELQRICNVQFFAWMGWFPFLFYTTSWVGEVLHRYDDGGGDGGQYTLSGDSPSYSPSLEGPDTATERAGSFALLCWAGVAVVCGILIPKITPREIGLDVWPRNPFTLKNLWTMSLIWFAACMGMTWFVDSVWSATFVIAMCGVSWALAMWIPFAMVGEIISDMKDRLQEEPRHGNIGYGAIASVSQLEDSESQGNIATNSNSGSDDDSDDDNEDSTLLEHRYGLSASELESERRNSGSHLDAGLVLGVHNMYLVFPQFVDALIASCLFALLGSAPIEDHPFTPNYTTSLSILQTADKPEPIGWVLRFGGIMALVAAYLSRRL
ncbi:hypothetical protein BGZ76_000658 [Entomortierella beljakovae]|nr:hypothetical protein BGZ76_000658 [Entomortierella beljakovae]